MSRTLTKWYSATGKDASASKSLQGSAVEGVRLHLNRAHQIALETLERSVSEAAATAMASVQQHLVITLDDDLTATTVRKRVIAADLLFTPNDFARLPAWAQKLAATCPEIAMKFVRKEPYTIRIAWGVEKESTQDEVSTKRWEVKHLNVTMFLQQLMLQLADSECLQRVDSSLRGGVGQEVAQQLMSHIQLLDSGTVAKAEFPTVADRVQELKRKEWEDAVATVCTYASPFKRESARVLYLREYAADDKRGDRLINVDPEWARVLARPCVKHLPLLFVSGKNISVVELTLPRRHTIKGNSSTFTATYIVLPVSKAWAERLPDRVREKISWWKDHGILETQRLLVGMKNLSSRTFALVIPISAGKKRFFNRVLPALQRGLPLQWQRVIGRDYRRPRTHRKWFAQLTIGYTNPSSMPEMAVGIHFGLTDMLWWALADKQGNIVDQGSIQGNAILDRSLAEKKKVEDRQRNGQYVGGRQYNKLLRSATYEVVNKIIEFAMSVAADRTMPIGLGLETIRFVDKYSGSSAANARYSNWNYGQLCTMIGNKVGPAGISVTEITLKKDQRKLLDDEQARALAREAVKRFADRAKRLHAKKRKGELLV